MLETKRLFAAGLALASLATTGCYDFDTAFQDCVADGRCNRTECDPTREDQPDDAFQDTNCDGIDGTASAAFFVDPLEGRDNNPGTPEAPFKSFAHAVRRASSEHKALYLAQGTYDDPSLLLDKPVSLYGGYARVDGGWTRGKEHTTHLGGGSVGLTVSGLGEDAGVVIDHVRITSSTGQSAGEPSIGMRVLNSKGVRLRYVEILAGAGARGADGASASDVTQSGADGGVGQSPTAPGAVAEGGPPGTSACGGLPGGKGGKGGASQTSPLATAGEPGQPSTDGGTAGGPRNEPFCSRVPCTYEGLPGGKGQDGLPGDAGTDGPPGNPTGKLSSDSWVPEFGLEGGAGAPGGGGAGGGGGGHIVGGSANSEGGGGGGGGSGGCPGIGAAGGGGGGASIALLLIQGQVELEFSLLRTADGGQGGAGGQGGNGSSGGVGGPGGKGPSRSDAFNTVSGGQGGNGGTGGTGGRGGHGGNGGGGPSVGIWCGPSSSFAQANTVFTLGNPGQPGTGLGRKDTTGLKAEQHQCPNP
ncbi:PE-PGRS family protein [Archangium sp.]|jgi:hypothetical protein|uniref:PE-PGRS family protein n=1 Tax=Archangium sp. TaxID=1872627 RepID=UPI002ED9F0EC